MLSHTDEEDGEVYPYYVNEDTGESIWEHPLLGEFKGLTFMYEKPLTTACICVCHILSCARVLVEIKGQAKGGPVIQVDD